MKLVLMGTNAFVVPMFERIVNAGHDILAVFTRAPRPVGRKRVITPSPVDAWAADRGLPVYYNPADYNFSPDMVVVVSYGEILRDNVLKSAPCVNIHPSKLPKYRGPSPIRTAIYNGDNASAVCLMQITRELDAGDVYMCREFEIGPDDTNDIIESRVSQIGGDMLVEFLSNPSAYVPRPQVGPATYTRKFTGRDEIIDWNASPCQIHNRIRALGVGRCKINGMDMRILQTRVVDGKLEIMRIQPAGKKPMDWKSFVNGMRGEQIKFE